MAGTFDDPANSLGVIPSFLFNATDASTHIFDLLTGSNSWTNVSRANVTDWTESCNGSDHIFSGTLHFLGCLLYPNISRNIQDGSLSTNLTQIGFLPANQTGINLTASGVSTWIRSIYPTCLVAYCAPQSKCGASQVCQVGNLLTSGYELSAQGVAECWLSLCSTDVESASVNPDIAGIGVCPPSLSPDNGIYEGFLLKQSRS